MCLAIPGQLVAILPNPELAGDRSLWAMGQVRFGGVIKEISLAYVPEAQVGDYVLVHAGFALSAMDEAAAQATLEDLAAVLAPDSAL